MSETTMSHEELKKIVRVELKDAGYYGQLSTQRRNIASKIAKKFNKQKLPTPRGQEYWTSRLVMGEGWM